MPLTHSLLRAMNAGETDEVVVALVTITDPETSALRRFSSDNAERFSIDPLAYGTTSRGNNYDFVPMSLTLPASGVDVAPVMQVNLDSVMREATPLLRSIRGVAQVTIELVLASSPDDVELSFPNFDLSQFDISAGSLTVSLTLDSLAFEPFPGPSFNASSFPGLY